MLLSNAYFVPTETTNSVVIVSIDDKSLAEYGRTPAEWSRTLFGDLAEVVADNAIDYLDMSKESDNPFFMYLAFNAPHDPRQAPKKPGQQCLE